MKRFGHLIFTGRHENLFNLSRSVADILISLSRQYNYHAVNVDEVLFALEIETLKMVDKGELQPGCILATRKQVVAALNDVARRSEAKTSKFIPHGIKKVNSVYYRFQPPIETVIR